METKSIEISFQCTGCGNCVPFLNLEGQRPLIEIVNGTHATLPIQFEKLTLNELGLFEDAANMCRNIELS